MGGDSHSAGKPPMAGPQGTWIFVRGVTSCPGFVLYALGKPTEIIKSKKNLGYFLNTSCYLSWVSPGWGLGAGRMTEEER